MGGRSKLEALGPIQALLRRGIETDDDARELASLLAPAVGSDAIAIGGVGTMAGAFQENVPAAWFDAYRQHGAADPSLPVLVPSPPGTWFFCERTLDESARDSPFVEGFRAASLHDIAIARLYSPFCDDLVFVLYRGRGRRAFGDEEALILELLYPHLASALATRHALGAARVGAKSPSVEIGFPRAHVEVPAHTWRFLEERLGRLSGDGKAKIERAVLAAARRFTAANIGGRSQRILPELRLELAALLPERRESARLRGTFLDERAPRVARFEPELAPIEAMLSPRERAVARLAAMGASVATIAEGERVGAETVRTHLRAIYRKLGVHSRAALASRLSQR